MKISNYTVPELDTFKNLCNFSEDELEYFNLKSRDVTNTQIALMLSISESKVSKLARSVKDKIRRVEKHTKSG